MNKETDYRHGNLMPMIIRFSLPAALSLLISAVYNIVDRIFIGNFIGESALAGLSVCFPFSYMMIAIALMLSAGGATLFSIFRGQGQSDRMNRAFGNAFVAVIILETILTVILEAFPEAFLSVFGVTDTCHDYALTYYRIVSLGCIFQGFSFIFCDFTRVSGKPVAGMRSPSPGPSPTSFWTPFS